MNELIESIKQAFKNRSMEELNECKDKAASLGLSEWDFCDLYLDTIQNIIAESDLKTRTICDLK